MAQRDLAPGWGSQGRGATGHWVEERTHAGHAQEAKSPGPPSPQAAGPPPDGAWGGAVQPEGPRQRAVAVRGPKLLTWQSVSPADPSAPSSMPEVQGGPSFAPQVSRMSLDTRLEAGGWRRAGQARPQGWRCGRKARQGSELGRESGQLPTCPVLRPRFPRLASGTRSYHQDCWEQWLHTFLSPHCLLGGLST